MFSGKTVFIRLLSPAFWYIKCIESMFSLESDVLYEQTWCVYWNWVHVLERRCFASLHLIPINIVYQYLFRYYRIFLFMLTTATAAHTLNVKKKHGASVHFKYKGDDRNARLLLRLKKKKYNGIKRCDYFIVMFHSGNIHMENKRSQAKEGMVISVWHCLFSVWATATSTNIMPNEVCWAIFQVKQRAIIQHDRW